MILWSRGLRFEKPSPRDLSLELAGDVCGSGIPCVTQGIDTTFLRYFFIHLMLETDDIHTLTLLLENNTFPQTEPFRVAVAAVASGGLCCWSALTWPHRHLLSPDLVRPGGVHGRRGWRGHLAAPGRGEDLRPYQLGAVLPSLDE